MAATWPGRLPVTAGDATRAVFADATTDVALAVRNAVAADLHTGHPTAATRRRLRRQLRRATDRMRRDGLAALRREANLAAGNGHKAAGGALRRAGLGSGPRAAAAALTAESELLLREAVGYVEAAADQAYRAAVSTSDQVAAQRVLNRLADDGLGGYAAGRHVDLASYADMVAVNTARDASSYAAYQRWTAGGGPPLMLVPVNSTACRLCSPWEGRTLSVDGSRPEYPTLKEAEAAGLHHPNCRHVLIPAALAATGDQLTGPVQSLAGSEAVREQQRYLERGIRQWRRRELVALDSTTAAGAGRHRRMWQARQRDHVTGSSAKRDYSRERA